MQLKRTFKQRGGRQPPDAYGKKKFQYGPWYTFYMCGLCLDFFNNKKTGCGRHRDKCPQMHFTREQKDTERRAERSKRSKDDYRKLKEKRARGEIPKTPSKKTPVNRVCETLRH